MKFLLNSNFTCNICVTKQKNGPFKPFLSQKSAVLSHGAFIIQLFLHLKLLPLQGLHLSQA